MHYGLPKADDIAISIADDGAGGFKVTAFPEPIVSFLLYYAVRMYFDNGGRQCYIVSVGNYQDTIALSAANGTKGLQVGLEKVALEDEPTLLVIPEAVKLAYADYKTLAQKMLDQCGTLRDRFAILDVWNGDKRPDDDVVVQTNPQTTRKLVDANRDAWTGNLKYGAAYYPFVRTAMNHHVNEAETNVAVTVGANAAADLGGFKASNTKVYNFVKSALGEHFVTMPPSGAVAGVYAATDGARGVWKAPANVGLAGVLEPIVRLDNATQDGLNVDATTGKSINAIRAFAGKGTLVWGARTLAGNDNEWRYISVRRFFNMVEESCRKATEPFVFEPNAAGTWIKVKAMIENFLVVQWRAGALAGAKPEDAFYVRVGLGTTMTAQDILEGRMIVEIGMAVVRPAEFIVLRFSHKMQES
jgi:hypothetical protein